jgi:hypothetical protein
MAGDEHPELRLHDVQPLALVPADPVQLALKAPAGSGVDIDDDSLATCAAAQHKNSDRCRSTFTSFADGTSTVVYNDNTHAV